MKIIISSIAALMIAAVPAAAEKFKGKWNGEVRSTVEIVKSSPLTVKYCFKRDCSLHKPSGDLNKMTFGFAKGGDFPGAKIVLTKTAAGYDGTYQRTGETKISTIAYK